MTSPKIFGIEHIIYLVVSTTVVVIALLLAKKFAKTDKAQTIVLKVLAGLLFVSIVTNRISQVYLMYDEVKYILLIPETFCGMNSLLLSIAVLFGKKDNFIYHFIWIVSLFGGIVAVVYPPYLNQGDSIFFIPTFTSLLHHSFSATIVITLFMFKQFKVTYKKWWYSPIGFTCYLVIGAILLAVSDLPDAYNIILPVVPDTPLTVWVMLPIYAVVYSATLFVFELVRKKKLHKN